MSQQQFVDVILPLPLGQFTYAVPEEFNDQVSQGKRVIVQFGKRKLYSALIVKTHFNKPAQFEAKFIENVLDESPVVVPIQFTFWQWIANYYMCTEGEVYKAALPSGLKMESQSTVFLNNAEASYPDLSPTEDLICQFLLNRQIATIEELIKAIGKDSLKCIHKLLSRNIIRIEEKIDSNYQPRKEAFISLSEEYNTEQKLQEVFLLIKRARKQEQVLMEFLHLSHFSSPSALKEISRQDLLIKTHGAQAALSVLLKKKILIQEEKEVNRLTSEEGNPDELKSLNDAQQKAFYEVKASFDRHPVVLLHGVTSSGKTEIYMHLIKEYMDRGFQVLYLLPEIGLTTQITTRLQNVFGKLTGIYHSRFSDNERVETWNRVLAFADHKPNAYQLILGARSSLFLPFSKLGLIIVDEEHETSYKQFDPAPRYHARDAAILLAHLCGAKTLLGTATPSIESYYNAQSGKYGFVELSSRYLNLELPATVIADTRDAYKRKLMQGHLTPALYESIEAALSNNQQVILFQNRRGFAPFIQCKACGWIPQCPHCDVSLTYHKNTNSLNCHYCGYSTALPHLCHTCHSEDLETKGFGTEKIEEEVKILFPEAKVGRMDLDTTRKKKAFENIIFDFEQHKIDILIGTQMITKGLDFENVSLVGILNADNLFNFPDFRATERSFQLIAQVSGRAGRKHGQGKVIIQTATPDHPVLSFILKNDYIGMYKSQLSERQQFQFPPFFRLIVFTLRHRDQSRLNRAAGQFASLLKKAFGNRVLGPQDAVISRMQSYYQKTIWLKTERQLPPSQVKKLINSKISLIKNIPENSTLQIIADVDPN